MRYSSNDGLSKDKISIKKSYMSPTINVIKLDSIQALSCPEKKCSVNGEEWCVCSKCLCAY